jgi:hypothetical protein
METAEVIPMYPKEMKNKCSFCGRDLFYPADKWLINDTNGATICFNPCVIKAQKIIEESNDAIS